MSINQQPYLQGYYAVEQLALQTKFGLRPANVDTGTFLVDKSNIAEVQHLISIGKG
jgi:simple sugar transport system substrate-binding protein